ncbi:MAG: anti-sigma factor family protein [Clostridia bacterium]
MDCNVIRDLLPGYVDQLSSAETNHIVEAHLRECTSCSAALEQMKHQLILPQPHAEGEADFLKIVKKYTHKRVAIAVCIVLLLIVIIAATGLTIRWFTSEGYVANPTQAGYANNQELLFEIASREYSEIYGPGELTYIGHHEKAGKVVAIFRTPSGQGVLLQMDRDSLFKARYWSSGIQIFDPGKILALNYGYRGNAYILMYGIDLPEEMAGYRFGNDGVIYQCRISDTSGNRSVLDLFVIPAEDWRSDISSAPMPFDQDGNPIEQIG